MSCPALLLYDRRSESIHRASAGPTYTIHNRWPQKQEDGRGRGAGPTSHGCSTGRCNSLQSRSEPSGRGLRCHCLRASPDAIPLRRLRHRAGQTGRDQAALLGDMASSAHQQAASSKCEFIQIARRASRVWLAEQTTTRPPSSPSTSSSWTPLPLPATDSGFLSEITRTKLQELPRPTCRACQTHRLQLHRGQSPLRGCWIIRPGPSICREIRTCWAVPGKVGGRPWPPAGYIAPSQVPIGGVL